MKILAGLPTQVAAVNLDADRWCAASAASTRGGLLDALRRSTDGAPGPGADGLAEFSSVQGDLLRNRLVEWLRHQVAAVLRLNGERVPEEQTRAFSGVGFSDGPGVTNRLERHLHTKLSATLVWNYPTIAKLAEFLQKRIEDNQQKGRSDEPRVQQPEVPVAGERAVARAEALSASEMLETELLEAETLLNTRAGAP